MARQPTKRHSPIGKIVNELAPAFLPNRTPLEALTRRFLARKRYDGTDAALSRLAQDFLEWTPVRWDTQIGPAYWPDDVAGGGLQYSDGVDQRKIVKLIKRIMALQQRNKRGSMQQRGRPAEEESDGDIEHDDQRMAPSEATIEPTRLSANRQQGRRTPAGSPELSGLPEVADLIGNPDADFTLSDHDASPRVVEPPFVTPSATSSRPASRRMAQPRRSIETSESSRFHPLETLRRTPPTWKPHTPTSRSSIAEGKRRQRSPTALPVYHPTIPRTAGGAPDRILVNAFKEGVHFARRILLDCGNDFRKAERSLEKVGQPQEAQKYYLRGVGVDETLEKLDESLMAQQRRLDEAETQSRDDNMSDEDAVEA